MYDYFKKTLRLSYSLAKTQFKLRNEGSYIGVFWYLLDPLAMFLIILILGKVITRTDIQYYPLYLLLGLIMFNFFRQTTINSVNAITSNSGYLKSMKISSEAFVVSASLQSAFSHFFELTILICFIIFFKVPLAGIIFYPFIFFFLFLFSLGFSFILATLGVYVNDLGNVWTVIINLLWFSTPIFYIISPGEINMINKLNPMFYLVLIARDLIIYGRIPPLNSIWFVAISSAVFLLTGTFIFEKFKKKFAQLI